MDRQRAAYCALLFTVLSAPCCLACNGYSITKIKIGNCKPNGNDILTVGNLKIKVNSDCTAKVTGCLTLKKQVNSATVRYAAKKGLVALNGNKDICKEAQNASDDIANLLRFFKIRPACPFNQMKICGPAKSYDITKYKSYLSMMQGDATVEITGKTDSGAVCVKASLTIAKNSRG